MTEAEWDNCTHPAKMLEFLENSGKVSKRKLLLFTCACYRRIWPLLEDERIRQAVEVTERYADRLAGRGQLADAWVEVGAATLAWPRKVARDRVRERLGVTAARVVGEAYARLRSAGWNGMTGSRDDAWFAANREASYCSEPAHRCHLFRDLLGNPFRPVSVDPAWLTWNDGTVVKLAQRMYEEWALQDLPVLADALEEAGCTEVAILSHCRQQREHVRGCWVVDVILGKT